MSETTIRLAGALGAARAHNQSGDVAATLEAFVAKYDDLARVVENHPDFLPNLLAVSSDYVAAMKAQGLEVPSHVTQWRKAVLLELDDRLPKKRWSKLGKFGKALLPTQAAMKRAKKDDRAEHKRLSVQVLAMQMLAMPSDARRLDSDSEDIEDVALHDQYFVADEGMAELQDTLAKLRKLSTIVAVYTDDADAIHGAQSAILKEVNRLDAAARDADPTVGAAGYGGAQQGPVASATGGTPSVVAIRSR